MIIHRTKQIIQESGFLNKKRFGQNFLIDPSILNHIIEVSGVSPEVGVIEVGTGLGTLTEALAQHAREVISFEVDEDLKPLIKQNLAPYPNITVYFQDFLEVEWSTIWDKHFKEGEVLVVANVPYYITTPILFKILTEKRIKSCLLMVQKEVGDRLTGKPNTKDYNALSALMAYQTKTKIVGRAPKNCFYPAPDVDSVLLRIEQVKNDYRLNNEPRFLKFIKDMFVMRRKTFANNIATQYELQKEYIEGKLIELGFSKSIRSEAMNIDEIVAIYRLLFEQEGTL